MFKREEGVARETHETSEKSTNRIREIREMTLKNAALDVQFGREVGVAAQPSADNRTRQARLSNFGVLSRVSRIASAFAEVQHHLRGALGGAPVGVDYAPGILHQAFTSRGIRQELLNDCC